jgi:hypothetical protein
MARRKIDDGLTSVQRRRKLLSDNGQKEITLVVPDDDRVDYIKALAEQMCANEDIVPAVLSRSTGQRVKRNW